MFKDGKQYQTDRPFFASAPGSQTPKAARRARVRRGSREGEARCPRLVPRLGRRRCPRPAGLVLARRFLDPPKLAQHSVSHKLADRPEQTDRIKELIVLLPFARRQEH